VINTRTAFWFPFARLGLRPFSISRQSDIEVNEEGARYTVP